MAQCCCHICLLFITDSEDEVEDIEERVPSPDVATEESAQYFDQNPWYATNIYSE